MKRANVLSGLAVDRASGLRSDSVRLADSWGRPETRVLPVWRSKRIVVSEEPSRVAFVGPDRFRDRARENAILLGQGDGTTFFAVDVSEVDEPLDELGLDDVHAIMAYAKWHPCCHNVHVGSPVTSFGRPRKSDSRRRSRSHAD